MTTVREVLRQEMVGLEIKIIAEVGEEVEPWHEPLVRQFKRAMSDQQIEFALEAVVPPVEALVEALEDVYANVASDRPEMWTRVLNALTPFREGS